MRADLVLTTRASSWTWSPTTARRSAPTAELDSSAGRRRPSAIAAFGPLRLPSFGEARYHPPSGEYAYGQFEMRDHLQRGLIRARRPGAGMDVPFAKCEGAAMRKLTGWIGDLGGRLDGSAHRVGLRDPRALPVVTVPGTSSTGTASSEPGPCRPRQDHGLRKGHLRREEPVARATIPPRAECVPNPGRRPLRLSGPLESGVPLRRRGRLRAGRGASAARICLRPTTRRPRCSARPRSARRHLQYSRRGSPAGARVRARPRGGAGPLPAGGAGAWSPGDVTCAGEQSVCCWNGATKKGTCASKCKVEPDVAHLSCTTRTTAAASARTTAGA